LGRERPVLDGAEPSGSAVAFENTARLAVITEQETWMARAQRNLAFYEPHMRQRPSGVTHALLALDFMAGPVLEVVLASSKTAGDDMGSLFHHTYCPRKAMVHGGLEGTPWDEVASLVPWVSGKAPRSHQATVFLCSNGRCETPATDPVTLREQLRRMLQDRSPVFRPG
jgi:hypothetical protein